MKLYAGMLLGPRSRQEDCLVIGDQILQEAQLPITRITTNCLAGIAAISDGLGGAPDGNWISHETCRFLSRLSNALAYCDTLPAILDALQDHLCKEAQTSRCGATLTGAIFRPDDHVTIVHLGDSRAYLKRSGQPLEQLTVDHTPVMDKVLAGELSRDDAQTHPMRNIVDLGVGPAFGPNWEGCDHSPQITDVDLMHGDSLLITSDGLHTAVDHDTLDAFVGDFDPVRAEDRFRSFSHLIEDNASIILMQA